MNDEDAEDMMREVARERVSPQPPPEPTDEWQLARMFHETYERLAPEFGYRTREESAKPWDSVPHVNKQLMAATCKEILAKLAAPQGVGQTARELLAATGLEFKRSAEDWARLLNETLTLRAELQQAQKVKSMYADSRDNWMRLAREWQAENAELRSRLQELTR